MSKALITHTLAFYEELEKRAVENPPGVRVFEGHTTKVMNYLNISSSWHSRILRILEECGSIVILQRGTVNQPSIVRLLEVPSEERLYKFLLTQAENLATVVAGLERRVSALEGWRMSQGGLDITQAMANHESRLSQLEFKQEREAKVSPNQHNEQQTNQKGK